MNALAYVQENKPKLALVSVPLALVPGLAFAEEATTSTIENAVTNMATSVSNSGQSMIAAVLPVIAPLIAAVIIATLGVKLVRRFSK